MLETLVPRPAARRRGAADERRRQSPDSSASPLQRIARHLLDERLDELTATAVARVQSDEPEYAVLDGQPGRPDARHAAHPGARAAAPARGDRRPTTSPRPPPRSADCAPSRALPSRRLLHSYRIDLRILWEAIIAEGGARGYASDEDFLDSCILVWEAVEANIAEVVDAYRRTEEDLARRLDVLRGRAFERLVWKARATHPRFVKRPHGSSCPVEARYLVLVGEGVPVSHETLVSITARLRARGLSSLLRLDRGRADRCGAAGGPAAGGHRRPARSACRAGNAAPRSWTVSRVSPGAPASPAP